MKRILALRPSPAMAVAATALFVALGGVSYGVATGSIDSREIADNTIRSKDVRNNNLRSRDLRNNEVRGIDIRNGTIRRRDVATDTLTGDQILERKLGEVPSAAEAADAARAAQAANAARLGGLLPSDFARSAVEAVRAASLESGDPAAGHLAPGFWKDPYGVVHLQGTVDLPGLGTIFTLPAGHRPGATARFLAPGELAGDSTTVEVTAGGSVDVSPSGPVPDRVSLDGISFRAG